MKKLLLFPLVLVLACSTAFSQGTIKNNSYFNLIWSRPIMDNGVIYGSETPNNLREFYKAKYGTDLSHYSGAINVGANFYIHPIGWLIEGFKAGLCLDFIDLGADYYKFSGYQQNPGGLQASEEENFTDLKVSYSLNVGVIATMSPVKNFYIDLTAKLCPTFGVNYFKLPAYQVGTKPFERKNTGTEWGGYEVPGVDYRILGTKDAEETGIGLGLDYAFGFNIRYSKLSVGCEWLLGNIKYSYENWDEQKVNNQQLKVKLGFSFE